MNQDSPYLFERKSLFIPRLFRRAMKGEELGRGIVFCCAASIIAITSLLVYELWIKSAPSIEKFGWSFFVTQTWDPIAGEFGALPFIYGTVITSVLALVFAIPTGVGAAVFLAELAPSKMSDPLTFLIELLAAVPNSLREGALALGACKLKVDIPYLAKLAQDMIRDSLDAFMKKDPELARNVLLSDDAVDSMRDRMYQKVVGFMEQDPTMVHPGIDYIFIARGLERLADHATNIAEDVLFYVRGIDVRHNQNII